MEEETYNKQILLLEALKKAAKDLKTIPIPLYSSTNFVAIQKIFELESQLNSLFSSDPILSSLFGFLSNLKTQFDNIQTSRGYNLRSLYRSQIANYEVSKIATSIEAKVQFWIDRESLKILKQALLKLNEEEEKLKDALVRFQRRLSSGFDSNLQEMILKEKLFRILESIVCDVDCSKRIREQSSHAILALVEFNKDVFVGELLMGNTIEALVSMASCDSIQVLASLVKLIKIPLVYELEENNYIPKICSLLSSKHLPNQLAAMECILELAYFARKDAIEAMLEEGLTSKLLELHKLEVLCELDDEDSLITENSPFFKSCLIRFVRNVETGEGLEKEEKRELKLQILKRIREASGSELEATSIIADILWGSSPILT